jgi:hypothetical protein
MLQIHGGADVRGGYTAPHIFAFKAREHEVDDFYLTDGDYFVSVGEEQWDTDNHGYHWHRDGSGNRSMDQKEFAEHVRKFLGISKEDAGTEKFEGDLVGTSIQAPSAGRILQTPEKRTQSYDVYSRGRLIDTVFYDAGGNETIADVKKDLIEHDHYDPGIIVVKGR